VISDKHKCIHVHIPRTAGSSVEKVLGYDLGKGDHRTIHQYKALSLSDDARKPPDWDHVLNRYGKYFKFSFVRNPWSKMVSHFIWMMMRRRSSLADHHYTATITFKDWLQGLANPGSTAAATRASGGKDIHTRNQLDWLCDKRWNGNKAPKDFKIEVDFIGRFENLEEDWNFICQKLNLKTKLPHERPGIQGCADIFSKDYREYYDDETIEIVRQRYEDDIRFFKYKFENE